MTSQQIHLDRPQVNERIPVMDHHVCEGKLVELEQKIASLQHLIAELLATNQQLREQGKGRD